MDQFFDEFILGCTLDWNILDYASTRSYWTGDLNFYFLYGLHFIIFLYCISNHSCRKRSMQMLSISHILAYIAARYGGPPRAAISLGRETKRIGHKVTYWATGDADDRLEVAANDLRIRLYNTIWPKSWFRSPILIQEIRNEISSIDIFHLHEVWSYPQYAAAKLAREREIPYIISPRGSLNAASIHRKGLKKQGYLRLMGRRMLNNSSCLHAVSPFEIEGFRRIGYKGPAVVIPNGVNMDDYMQMPDSFEADEKWPKLSGRRVVLYLSRLSPEKGLDQLILAWADLTACNSYDDAVLVLAGPDDRGYRAFIEALVEGQGLESNVIFTGMVQNRKKEALISRCDIYVLPSYSEGFSLSILENMAAGNPVLITPGCNFPEVTENRAGVCVQPERFSLLKGLRNLLDMSVEDRHAMGRRGRELVSQNYTWDSAARKMADVYRCILEGKEIPMYPEPVIN